MTARPARTLLFPTDTCRVVFFFSSRRRHTIFDCDWSSDVCSSDLKVGFVREDALRGVNRCCPERNPLLSGLTVPGEEAPANSVPAAAVIQRARALSDRKSVV